MTIAMAAPQPPGLLAPWVRAWTPLRPAGAKDLDAAEALLGRRALRLGAAPAALAAAGSVLRAARAAHDPVAHDVAAELLALGYERERARALLASLTAAAGDGAHAGRRMLLGAVELYLLALAVTPERTDLVLRDDPSVAVRLVTVIGRGERVLPALWRLGPTAIALARRRRHPGRPLLIVSVGGRRRAVLDSQVEFRVPRLATLLDRLERRVADAVAEEPTRSDVLERLGTHNSRGLAWSQALIGVCRIDAESAPWTEPGRVVLSVDAAPEAEIELWLTGRELQRLALELDELRDEPGELLCLLRRFDAISERHRPRFPAVRAS